MSEQPGRYSRSVAGLVAAMVVTLLAIGGLVTLRELLRDDLVREPEPLDYLAAVDQAHGSGLAVVYPRSVPEGWIATSVDLTTGDRPGWGLGFLTAEERFVGLRQEDDSLEDLLSTYVDEETRELPRARIGSEVSDTWRVFEDDGGDRAYAAETGGEVVLVYGSAPHSDLELAIGRLTTRRPPAGEAA